MKNGTHVYVGNIHPDAREKDIDVLFAKYGKIKYIQLKKRKPKSVAFVVYDDARDAAKALRGRDGYEFRGNRLRVQLTRRQRSRARGGRPTNDRGNEGSRGDCGGVQYAAGYGTYGRPQGEGKRTDYRVLVTGLPPSGSWQDLKDHMREAGDVCHTDVYKDGSGIVEFACHGHVKNAVLKMDGSLFRSNKGERTQIGVKEVRSNCVGSRSRSPRRHPHRSRSRSPRGNSRRRRTDRSPHNSPSSSSSPSPSLSRSTSSERLLQKQRTDAGKDRERGLLIDVLRPPTPEDDHGRTRHPSAL